MTETPQAPTPMYPTTPAAPPQGNGLAIAGMVLGIVSLALFCVYWLAIPCAIVGLILSIIGLKKSKVVGKGHGMALAGVITSIVALGLAILIIILIAVGVAWVQLNANSMSTTAPAEEMISVLRLRF